LKGPGREEWRKRVDEFLKAGKTQAQWSRDNGIDPKQLSYWIRTFKSKENKSVETKTCRFIPANVIRNNNQKAVGLSVKIGDATIKIEPGFNKELLLQVVKVLGAI